MDDGEVILIAPDRKNQDGSQTYFILDPCPSEDCVDDSQGIELIDLTDEYKVQNTGAIAVVSTNSTGALEITLKKPEEEMDPKGLSETKKPSGDIASSSDGITIVDMITDDDTVRPIKDEDEEVDVEEISIHDISAGSSNLEQKSEPELVDLCESGVEQQSIQNDQDDDTEEGTLYIDDAKYNELQEELAQESLEELNHFKENVMQQLECTGQENMANISNAAEVTENSASNKMNAKVNDIVEDKKENEVITMTFDVVSCPAYIKSSKKYQMPQEAFTPAQLKEIPMDKQSVIEINEKEITDSTALTLLELAGGTGVTGNDAIVRETENEITILQSEETGTVEEIRPVLGEQNLVTLRPAQEEPTLATLEPAPEDSTLATLQPVQEEPTLATLQPVQEETTLAILQPVQLDPPVPDVLLSQNLPKEADVKKVAVAPVPKAKTDNPPPPKTDNPPPPKTPVVRMTPEELVQRLREGDTPRHGAGKEPGRRGRDMLYMSPLVTKADIAQEFMDRQLQKNPYTEPAGGDVIFAMKLAHRLATKIVQPETNDPQSQEPKSRPREEDGANSSENNSAAKSSESEKEPKKNYAISDKIELLKILEDDPDDVSSLATNQIVLEHKVKSDRKKSAQAPLIKMHPELEKELALKQLQDFSQGIKGKKRVSFTSNKNTKLDKDHEHNNNFNSAAKQTNGTKKRASEVQGRPPKKIKKEDLKPCTADPSHITETLTVEGQSLSDDQSPKDGKSLKQYSNKRLSRSSETPPRTLPMDIVLNGIDDTPAEEENSSKNKIFKATNPRKRKEELQEKRQKHITKQLLQLNKPAKKRGRPPKKKSYPSNDELNKEFLLKESLKTDIGKEENEESLVQVKEEKPTKTKKMREIERLLGDEGAINMLYSVEQKRASGGESKRGMLPSYRRKKKDLILKTKLVKSAVLRLTTNPALVSGRVSLRGQAPKEVESEGSEKNSTRKMSVDSHDSHHSLSSPPPEPFSFPAKIVPAEASRIIRRHSSSSNYSSRSNSPRRPSVDGERSVVLSPETKTTEDEQVEHVSTSSTKQKQVRTPQNSTAESTKKLPDKSERLMEGKTKESDNDTNPQPDSDKKSNEPDKIETPRTRGRRRIFVREKSKTNSKLSSTLAAAVEDFAKENKSGGKNIPVETPKKSLTAVPSEKTVYRPRKSADTVRRTPKPSKVYKEITLKRHDQVVEICLSPVSTKLQNAFNTNVLSELTSVLSGLSKDDNCHVVMISSQGAVFCQGVDFPALIKPASEQRKVAALEMAVAIKEFIKSVAMLARPVVVAVHAPCAGLGVTMLPLCDMVLAAEDSTFHTPYTLLGQVPEGAASLTFPSLLGPAVTSELLLACRKLSALEAQRAGLVTRVLPVENFKQEALSVAKVLSNHSAQAMNATRALLRHGLLAGLETTLVSESHLLTKLWSSDECQARLSEALKKGEYVLASASAQDGPKQPEETDK